MTKQEKAKDARLRREFHITLEEQKKVISFQKNVCGICGKKFNKKGELLILYMDHNHASGELRGCICYRCNKGIAIFLDDPEALQKASDYLKLPPVEQVFGKKRFTASGKIGTKRRKKLLAAFNVARINNEKGKKAK